MKIAIQGHPFRGKEIIQILESLGGINMERLTGTCKTFYYINHRNKISDTFKAYLPSTHECYTLEEFEKEFPFKVGDKVFHNRNKATIEMFVPRETCYYIRYENSPIGPNYTKWVKTSELEPFILQFGDIVLCNNLKGEIIHRKAELDYYGIKVLSGEHSGKFIYTLRNDIKLMKKERNITLTLDKAKEWYNKGGELKEIALQAFTEKELTKVDLPKTWKEFCINYPIQVGEAIIDEHTSQIRQYKGIVERGFMHDRNICPSQKSAEAHLALIQLEQLRNCWWNGWEPIWDISEKWCIRLWGNELSIGITTNISRFLTFPTKEMAEEFLKCFRNLIEVARNLI